MIKNFKKLFAIILVFIFSSFYIVNINTFADELIYPFEMDGFESETKKSEFNEETDHSTPTKTQSSIILTQNNDSSPESYSPVRSFVSCDSISPNLKNQLDHAFGELQEIHPEIKANTDDYKTKLALICTYLCDLLGSKNPCFNQNQYFSISSSESSVNYYNEMKFFISDAVFALFNIDLHMALGMYGDGFDFLYSVNGMNFLEKSDEEIQRILMDRNLYKIFEPMKTNPDYSRLAYNQYGINFDVD